MGQWGHIRGPYGDVTGCTRAKSIQKGLKKEEKNLLAKRFFSLYMRIKRMFMRLIRIESMRNMRFFKRNYALLVAHKKHPHGQV